MLAFHLNRILECIQIYPILSVRKQTGFILHVLEYLFFRCNRDRIEARRSVCCASGKSFGNQTVVEGSICVVS